MLSEISAGTEFTHGTTRSVVAQNTTLPSTPYWCLLAFNSCTLRGQIAPPLASNRIGTALPWNPAQVFVHQMWVCPEIVEPPG